MFFVCMTFLDSFKYKIKLAVGLERERERERVKVTLLFVFSAKCQPYTTQSTFTYSKLTIETLEQDVKYVQS